MTDPSATAYVEMCYLLMALAASTTHAEYYLY